MPVINGYSGYTAEKGTLSKPPLIANSGASFAAMLQQPAARPQLDQTASFAETGVFGRAPTSLSGPSTSEKGTHPSTSLTPAPNPETDRVSRAHTSNATSDRANIERSGNTDKAQLLQRQAHALNAPAKLQAPAAAPIHHAAPIAPQKAAPLKALATTLRQPAPARAASGLLMSLNPQDQSVIISARTQSMSQEERVRLREAVVRLLAAFGWHNPNIRLDGRELKGGQTHD